MKKIICDRCGRKLWANIKLCEGKEVRIEGHGHVIDLCDKCCEEFEAWLMEKAQDETMGKKANADDVFEIKPAEGIVRIRPLSPIRPATTTEG